MSSVKSQPSSINHFYDLDVWKEAHSLSIEIYKLTDKFPKKETFAVVDQIRRASTSVGANIAEGFGRFHYKEKIKFYYNARGSVCEVQNFIFLAKDINYLEKSMARELFIKYENLNKRLNNFIRSVRKKMTDDC
ncbi:MAG: four helix bundle protein [Candidatus Moraniibacteriota bacterium]